MIQDKARGFIFSSLCMKGDVDKVKNCKFNASETK